MKENYIYEVEEIRLEKREQNKSLISSLFSSILLATAIILAPNFTSAQNKANDTFEQLGSALPTPNTYRTAAGTPGKDYFQNTADYDIKVELDDATQRIVGTEKVTYTNNSPDPLRYLWLQLDQNLFKPNRLISF